MRKMTYNDNAVSELFSVIAFDEERNIFFCSDESVAFSFICHPLSGGDDKTSNRVKTLLNNDWPKDTIIQFSLFSSPDINDELTSISRLRPEGICPIQQEAVLQKLQFFRNGTYQPVERLNQTKLRDFKLIFTVKVPSGSVFPTEEEMSKYGQLQQSTYAALSSCGMLPVAMTDDLYLKVMRPILNWHEGAGWKSGLSDPSEFDKPLNQQLFDYDTQLDVDATGLQLGDCGRQGRRIKVMTVKRLPKNMYFGTALNYLGDSFSGNRGIKDNFLINVNIQYPDSENRKTKLSSQKQWVTNQAYGPMLKFVPKLAQQKEAFDRLFEAFTDGDRPIHVCMSVLLFGKNEEDAIRASSNARTYFQDLGITLIEDRFFCLPMFLNSLPFGADRKAVRDMNRYKTMATRHVIPLLPLFCDWKGTGTPMISLISRNGQLMTLDLYDSSTNYNACICAQSGSGKSFLSNEIISSYLSVNGQIWVIDVGRSYQKQCETLGGTFIEFTEEAKICLNPFSIVENYEEEAEILVSLVSAMAAPTQRLSDFQVSRLQMHMSDVWHKHGTKMTVDAIADALLADDDGRVNDVGHQLFSFTSKGEYGRYFNGINNVRFDSQFNVLELEELKSKKHLQSVVLLQLVYQIQQCMYLGDKAVKKLALIDEAWDLLGKSETVADFLETGFRRFRKYNGSGIVVTQSVMDLYNTPTGRAIAENSANMYLLGQKEQSIEAVKEEKKLPLSDGGYELLKTVRTESGHYSEIFCLTDRGSGIGRLIVDPYRLLLYSTNPKDVAAIDQKRKQHNLSAEKAIKAVLTDRGLI
ncbi:IncHI-type conjugal transfer ATPase TrhC [Kistimonas scapharcae]|uniref:IncHI-type conjugal transfer ATPase TrhC n=1 Tax=Kistimonas scapharcae TaxID=1036133 RepID=A0ABP8UZQ4_9GAMM